MNIGLDIDDTLVRFSEGLLEWSHKQYGTTYLFEDITQHYNFELLWGCSLAEATRRITQEFYLSETHAGLELLPGVSETLTLFCRRGCELVTITSRPSSVEARTIELFTKLSLPSFKKHHFLGFENPAVTKADVCKQEEVLFFVDDALRHAIEVAGQGIPVILLDKPWNKGSLPDGIIRVSTWDDVQDEGLEIIHARKNRKVED